MTDRDPDYGHDCGPDCTCFGDRFAALRQDVRDFPTGEISVDVQEISRLLAAYDDALHGRELARLDTERERREVGHQAAIVADVRTILAEWSTERTHGRGIGDPETALRAIAKRVGYYVASDPVRALIEEIEG